MILKAIAPFSAMRELMERVTPGERTPDHMRRRTVTQIAASGASAPTVYELTGSSTVSSHQEFQLFETMYATREDGVRHLQRHLRRLQSSALRFGFAFERRHLCRLLSARCAEMLPATPYRIRATLEADGEFHISLTTLMALNNEEVNILLAAEQGFSPQSSKNEYLLHKGTIREEYDRAWRVAEKQGAFDMLFFNERGELTEGGRSNVFVKIEGRWWTPPVSSGLLPGVMRSVILEDPAWNSAERVLTRKDLNHADALMVCNALRGPLKARIVDV
jgi:para-aminobenzoate synthetase/4-amino-4-deoxychorismate lyase